MENENKNIESDQVDVETVDDLNVSRSEEETAAGNTVNEGGPPMSKRKKTAQVNKRMTEAFLLLKQVAAKPKAAKDESQIFCELLCFKLRGLKENCRERAMHEVNNLIYQIK